MFVVEHVQKCLNPNSIKHPERNYVCFLAVCKILNGNSMLQVLFLGKLITVFVFLGFFWEVGEGEGSCLFFKEIPLFFLQMYHFLLEFKKKIIWKTAILGNTLFFRNIFTKLTDLYSLCFFGSQLGSACMWVKSLGGENWAFFQVYQYKRG